MSNQKLNLIIHAQKSWGASPWPLGIRIRIFLWDIVWAVCCRWTPKSLNQWRLIWLRLFGANLDGNPFVHQHARIKMPWNLSMSDRACLADGANAYSLGPIEIHAGATVAQEAYLCSGTHDFEDPMLPLCTAKIVIEREAFLGARCFILPGVTIREGAIVGACAVVTKDVEDWDIVAGNPARSTGRKRSKTAVLTTADCG